jgi:hypothetical protein
MRLTISTLAERDVVMDIDENTTLNDIKQEIRLAYGVENTRPVRIICSGLLINHLDNDKKAIELFNENRVNTLHDIRVNAMVDGPYEKKTKVFSAPYPQTFVSSMGTRDLRQNREHEGLKLTVATLGGANLILHIDETTKIGQIKDQLNSIMSGPREEMLLLHNGKILVYANDSEEKSFCSHLAENGIDFSANQLRCASTFAMSPYEARRRVGAAFITDYHRLNTLESVGDSSALTSLISGEMIKGDVVKVNERFYGKEEFVQYLRSLKTKIDSNPAYIPVDPLRDPLPASIAASITKNEVQILFALQRFNANDEYSAKVRELDATSSSSGLRK